MELKELSQRIEELSGIKFSEEELSVLGSFSINLLQELAQLEKLELHDIEHLNWYKREKIPRLLKEGKELFECLVLDGKEGDAYVSVRNYCRGHEKPSDLLRILKPYLPKLEVALQELGYVRIRKGTWRKFDLRPLWQRYDKDVEKLAKALRLDEDSAYVAYTAYRLLKITNPFVRDWKGFNIVHAFAFYDRFLKPMLDMADINWMNERLLNYEEQIKMLGLDFARILKRWSRFRAENG